MKKIKKITLEDFSTFEYGRANNGGHYGFQEIFDYIPEEGMWLKSCHTSPEKVISNEQALLEVCHFIIISSHQSEALVEVYFQDGRKREIVLARKGWPDYETEETRNLQELYLLLADSVHNLHRWSRSYNLDQQFLPEAARIYPWLDPDSIRHTLSEAPASERDGDWDADYYRSAIPRAEESASILRQAIERELYNSLIWEEDRVSRIRRRVEDALRKGRPNEQVARRMLVKAALELEVRLD